MLRAEQRIGEQRSIETRYYIASVENDAKLILRAGRGHWGIENSLQKKKLKATYQSSSLSKLKGELDRRMAALKPSRTFTDTQSDS